MSIRDALRDALWGYGQAPVELEFRLGHVRPGGFVCDIGREAYDAVRKELDASTKWSEVIDTDAVDKIVGDLRYVTTTSLAVNEKSMPPPPPFWMKKVKLAAIDLGPVGDTPWSVRGSVAVETVEDGPPDGPVDAAFQRHKVRRRYVYHDWGIDVTRVTSNTPDQMDSDAEVYEIEIELIGDTFVYTRPLDHIIEYGTSIARDLVGFMAGVA